MMGQPETVWVAQDEPEQIVPIESHCMICTQRDLQALFMC